jgi:hypothetical protein
VFRRRDEQPTLARHANSEAQGRENLEEKVRIGFHPNILHARRLRRLIGCQRSPETA